MLLTASSPAIDNPPRGTVYDLPSVPANLEHAGLTWGNYGGYVFGIIKALAGRAALPSEQFATDAAAGKLPASAGCSLHTRSVNIRQMCRTAESIRRSAT